jgi:hypothetical protein
MDAPRAELSSAATTLEELAARVERVGDLLQGAEQESLAGDLYEVERNLRAAHRRLEAVLTRMA